MERKRYSSDQKVSILREYFEKNLSIADICEKYRIHPNQFYRWKKELFEGATQTFTAKKTKKSNDREIEKFKKVLNDRNEVIVELLQENLKLKKLYGEI